MKPRQHVLIIMIIMQNIERHPTATQKIVLRREVIPRSHSTSKIIVIIIILVRGEFQTPDPLQL